MDIDPQEIKQRFAELSDEALLAVERDELTEVADQIYGEELEERGLLIAPMTEGDALAAPDPNLPPGEELVHIATFLDFHDAKMAVNLLHAAEIPASVENEFGSAYGGASALRLMVPASLSEQAQEILDDEISEEELAAQAEAAGELEEELTDDEIEPRE